MTLLLLVVGVIALLELYKLSFPSRLSHLLLGVGLAGFTLTLIQPHFLFSWSDTKRVARLLQGLRIEDRQGLGFF